MKDYKMKTEDIRWRVEYMGTDRNSGKPLYKVICCWLLRTYETKLFGLMNIVTLDDSFETTVVRHVSQSRLFTHAFDAIVYKTKLDRGEVKYDKQIFD